MSEWNAIKSKLAFGYSEVFSGLAADLEFIFRVPTASPVFFGVALEACAKVTSSGSLVMTLFEGATATDAVAVVPLNRSRLDTPPACPVPVNKNTVPAGVAGTALNRAAASLSSPGEIKKYILKPGTNYLVRLTPTTTPTGVISFELCSIPNFDYLYKAQY
jgi:hypothetical protein